MLATVNTVFSEWLVGELADRDMSQSELSRRAGVTRTAISDIVNGRRNPGRELATSIAKAFSLPPEQVFRVAGFLPPAIEVNEEIEQIIHEVEQLPKQDQQEVLAYIRMKKNIRKKNAG